MTATRKPPSLEQAVKASIKALTLADEDQAAARLAERYAATIEHAEELAAAADDITGLDPDDRDAYKQLRALQAKVAAHQVMVDLGPKLLACLAELGMTPKARAAVVKGGQPNGNTKRSALDELRARRDSRKH